MQRDYMVNNVWMTQEGCPLCHTHVSHVARTIEIVSDSASNCSSRSYIPLFALFHDHRLLRCLRAFCLYLSIYSCPLHLCANHQGLVIRWNRDIQNRIKDHLKESARPQWALVASDPCWQHYMEWRRSYCQLVFVSRLYTETELRANH